MPGVWRTNLWRSLTREMRDGRLELCLDTAHEQPSADNTYWVDSVALPHNGVPNAMMDTASPRASLSTRNGGNADRFVTAIDTSGRGAFEAARRCHTAPLMVVNRGFLLTSKSSSADQSDDGGGGPAVSRPLSSGRIGPVMAVISVKWISNRRSVELLLSSTAGNSSRPQLKHTHRLAYCHSLVNRGCTGLRSKSMRHTRSRIVDHGSPGVKPLVADALSERRRSRVRRFAATGTSSHSVRRRSATAKYGSGTPALQAATSGCALTRASPDLGSG